jgi:hypothetical protein
LKEKEGKDEKRRRKNQMTSRKTRQKRAGGIKDRK